MTTLWDNLRDSELYERVMELLPDCFKTLYPPALDGMRLAPPECSHNPLMLQTFTWESKHERMSWWAHLTDEMPALADMGFTQLWLPPPNKAMRPEGQGYDAYDLWDLGEFDQKGAIPTRWGSKEELLQLTKAAKAHGIDALIDAVLNHKIGADRRETFKAVPVDPTNRYKEIGPEADMEGWTAFDFSKRNGTYSSLKWTHEHFSGLDWNDRTKTSGVYRITSDNHQGWSRWVDSELGNYDYLLGIDIDHRHPEVREDLFQWGRWILETTGASGFRLDAIKHMDRRFLREWLTRAQRIAGCEHLFAVAEYWSHDISRILPYIHAFRGQTSFFDVPLHYNLHNASREGVNYDLRSIFDKTLVQRRPNDAVTFVDNHDTQIGQSLESWVYSSFKLQAYALILLRGFGHPCVFYGDLYPNEECYDQEIADNLKLLIFARKRYAYGSTTDYFASRHCIGFVREGDTSQAKPGCVVILSNSPDHGDHSPNTIRMQVGQTCVGKTYRALLPGSDEVIHVDNDGWGIFSTPPNTVQVWVAES